MTLKMNRKIYFTSILTVVSPILVMLVNHCLCVIPQSPHLDVGIEVKRKLFTHHSHKTDEANK